VLRAAALDARFVKHLEKALEAAVVGDRVGLSELERLRHSGLPPQHVSASTTTFIPTPTPIGAPDVAGPRFAGGRDRGHLSRSVYTSPSPSPRAVHMAAVLSATHAQVHAKYE
jgi:hypothetical protein